MVAGRWAASLIVLTFSAPAWAEEELEMPVPVKVTESAAAAPAQPPSTEPGVRSKKRASVSYSAVLGSLPIARDLEMPGAVMSLRLLPTSQPLAGESSTPIVLRPRVPGGGGWYGVDIAARF